MPDAINRPASANPRFRAGARVLFDSNGVPVKGTVAKPNATGKHCMSPHHLGFGLTLHAVAQQQQQQAGLSVTRLTPIVK